MNCFVSGAGGGIGLALCKGLHAHGHTIVAGQRRTCDGPWDQFVQFDLARRGLRPQSLRGVSCVFHLAGKAHAVQELRQDEQDYFRINTEGTRSLLEASRQAGVRRFVFFSSVKAMGEGGSQPLDERAECHPETPYGRSKLQAERLVLEGGYVPEPVVLRLSMVYGAGSKGNLPRMIEAVSRGRFPPLPALQNRRSMVHVEDVVRAAILAAGRAEAVGQAYIVTDGQTYSTRQMYEWICEALNRPVPRWVVPLTMLKILAKAGDGIGWMRGKRFMFDSAGLDKLVGSACYSGDKIAGDLGFHARYDLRSALPEIVASLGFK